ncbi:MAG: glycosyltransferase [Desulfitobacteriaceae bacterium]|nr:glycosyltransferase [Desulfitobacteriaceae bacterium]
MRLCFLGDAGSIHLQRWLTYFANAGYEVHVISFRPSTNPVSGVTEHLLASGRSGRFAYLKGIAKIHKLVNNIRPDILHAHYATSFGLLAVFSGRHPLVVSAWGSDVLVAPEQSFWLRNIVQYVLRAADALTSDSAYMSLRMEKLLQGKKKRLLTVTMGVSREWFASIPETDKHPWQIVSLRGHLKIYNIDVIIRAMATVVKIVPQAKLVLAGEGPLTSSLNSLTHSLGLEHAIEFVGQLPHARVQAYLNESAVSVSVPSSDATAVSLLETMACGSFPVLSDVPANREWIEDEVNGLIVPSGDAHALALALIRSLQDSALREKAIAVNREKIRAKAIWEDNMAEVEALYRQLI